MKNEHILRRKYQVFISSTKEDLKEERRQVLDAILNMGCIAAGMENFPTGEKSWDLIKNGIDESDFFVLITAGCYGSTLDYKGREISFTEREYDYAKNKGMTVLVFAVKDINMLPRNKTDEEKERIIQFREKILNCGDNVVFWEDNTSLASVVKSSLGIAIKKNTYGGWVRLDRTDICDYQAELIADWGLHRIFKTRAEKNNESDLMLEAHNIKRLDGIAFGLRSFRSIRRADIVENLKKGMHMRLLVMNPNSSFARQRAIEEKEDVNSISKSIKELISWVDEVRSESNFGSIELKVYDAMTLDFYWRIDDIVYIGPYLYGIPSQQTLTIKFIKNGKGFSFYTEYFERLWNDTSLCHYPIIE